MRLPSCDKLVPQRTTERNQIRDNQTLGSRHADQSSMGRRMLVVGGSGYLGQFLVQHFAETDQVTTVGTKFW